MSQFTDVMQTNPPRVIVQYHNDGQDRFTWGIAGIGIPVMSLIGFIGVVQNSLSEGKLWEYNCEQKLIIAWDGKEFCWSSDCDIPTDPLCGMLELIKQTLVMSQLETMAQRQQQGGIIGPDGMPIRR